MEKEKEQPQEERLVKLTGLPISGRMKEILAKLGQGEGVTLDEIKDTPEMKLAESSVNDATPSYKLTNRDNLTAHIKEEMLKTGSAVIDSGGRVEYNGFVEKSSRLDIVIGLPASGKSSAIVDVLSSEFHSRVIDNDEAKKMIPQYNDGWGAGVVHVESQNISDDVFDISINQGDNIVLPKVGSDADKLADRYIAQAKECGYKVNIHYVELDRNKAMSRMINRFIDQGRYLAPELIEKYAPLGRENRIDIAYGELKDSGIIDGYSKWDNDVAHGERPVLIETNCKGGFIENARRDERTRINEEVAVAGEGILAGTQGGLVSADLRGGRSSARSERGIQENAQGRSEQAVAHRKNEASKQDKQVVQDRQHTGDERGGDFVATRRNAGAARGLGSEAGMDKGEACRAGKGRGEGLAMSDYEKTLLDIMSKSRKKIVRDNMSKYYFVAEVARETALRASKSPDDWMSFLRTAANNYKYSFSDQLLIHAQRPKATACATLETWNEKMGCWVNRGAKGIALLDAEKGRLNYVFDVSDVHPARGIGRLPKLWRMGEEHQEAIMERLEQTYGAVDVRLPFEDRVMTLAGRIAADYAWDILPDLQLGQEGSYLEDFDEQNLLTVLRETLSASIAYEVLARCGIDMERISERLDFSHIAYFNTPATIYVLGNAACEMSKPVLMEIGRAISAYDKEKSRQRKMALGSDLSRFPEQTENISTPDEKKAQKVLANGERRGYNAFTQITSDEVQNEQQKTYIEKGGHEHGDHISEERGLFDTKHSAERGARGDAHEVRADEEELSQGTQRGDISGNAPRRDAESTLSGNTGAGIGAGRVSDESALQVGESGRGAEGSRPDALGEKDERYKGAGGGDSVEGVDLRIDKGQTLEDVIAERTDSTKFEQMSLFNLFPSVDEQITDIHEKGAEKSAPFVTHEIDHRKNEKEQIKSDEKAQEEPQTQDKSQAVNFRITDNSLGTGTPKEKFQNNIEAIRTLKEIEEQNRAATPAEQEILSKYIGWGGLADAFDESKSAWSDEDAQLKEILTPAEYSAARESTLNAYYTSPEIISGIYEALGRMGFEKGNILEPSMGVGNFFGLLPDGMKASRLYGVELDSITGRIAKQLYPNADIQIKGFEQTDYLNDFFDVAVGNVPFGQYKVNDKLYDKNNFRGTGFLIHDYFFAKALDKVRPGGVVAFITSKGTMDKKSSEVRKYLAQRAELLGAVRLPNTAFKENAGTKVTSDIIFLKKRDRVMDIEPDWVHLSENSDGIVVNSYFAAHPEMVVGKMAMVSGPFGMESVCLPDTEKPFGEQLHDALSHIEGEIEEAELPSLDEELSAQVIPADPNVKNYSYAIVNGKVYYRENSVMKPADLSEGMEERIKGMVALRDCTRELIDMQLSEYPDEMIGRKQQELNEIYDAFSKKNGLVSSRTNKRAFGDDSSYCLLCSLERLDGEGNFIGKADMFSKRTIKRAEAVTSVDTASEALAVSLCEKAKVDFGYMEELTGKDEKTLTNELSGVIFKNPATKSWETADEYLSGNVRTKLALARGYAADNPEYAVNVAHLERVQPKELDASEIGVRLGATWIEPKYIEDFMADVFQTPHFLFSRNVTAVQYSDVTGQWNVKGKNADAGNSLVNITYGTDRANAYKILEDSLNLKDTRIFDTVFDSATASEKRVLNKKETMLASQKQEAIREAFKDWIFKDQERRETLCAKYNELFNSTRPREYDGAHLKFPGMAADIELKPHQKNAVAHVLYGGNTLLAHCVGAGKTFEMTAAAMESKRLGLCQKSLFVVPNHLTEQWASDFLRLYPGANILAATKKDFEPANRKKFCSRIATGDYDAVIIGHSQFEKIPLSQERQVATIEMQIAEIELAIEEAKAAKGERYTIKQMEKTKKSLRARLDKLNDGTRKDSVVTFEQLGVDRLFVDESHNYKNLFLYTKMRNVAGIAQTEAQKSSDMFAKCQYLDELTGGKGVTFATGTPISNSMTELYTNMRYLQHGTLQRLGLSHFDSWAASFGETVTAIELAPEGTGYRAKTRFAKFFNLPELIALFKESADIQTPDMLKLPVPEAEYENVVLKPSEYQKEIVATLADRAEQVRNGLVEPNEDNMLKITNDGRKLALDQRLINPLLLDTQNSKTSLCAEKAFEIWEQTKEQKSTQLIFCDLSTPKGDGTFNVYDDIKAKLMEKGVPEDEIAFIHDANTETRKAELFAKVRGGQVRFLLGSTQKMGAGTNVQDRLIALHHLDVPWRPSDIEQQEGRILRQGNQNEKVKIFRYVTEQTFDAYSWQVIENKQKFIGQIMTSKSPVRSCADIDEAALTAAEVKALATGNPLIKEKMDLDIQVSKLKLLKANHTSQHYTMEDNITKGYPKKIVTLTERINGNEKDIAAYEKAKENLAKTAGADEPFRMKVGEVEFTDKKEAGAALIAFCKGVDFDNKQMEAGEYMGFGMQISFDSFSKSFKCSLRGEIKHTLELGGDAFGNITRINNELNSMPQELEADKAKLENVKNQLEMAKREVDKPFPQEQELSEKLARLAELDSLLDMDEKGENIVLTASDQNAVKTDVPSEKKPSARAKLEAYKTKAAAASSQGKPPERGGIGNEQL